MADEELYKGQLEDLKAISSIQDSIKRSEEIIARTSGIVAKNQKIKKQQAEAALKVVQKEKQILTSVAKTSSMVANAFEEGTDQLKDLASNVPIIGNSLGKFVEGRADKANEAVSRMATAFTDKFTRGFRVTGKGAKTFTQKFNNGMKSGLAGIKQVAARIGGLSKLFAGLAVVAFFAIALAGFSKVEGAARSFRDETGLLRSQTQGLETDITNVTASTAALGASAADVANAATEFTKAFEGLEQPSAAVLENVVALEKNFGVQASTAAAVNAQFQQLSGLSAEAAQFQATQVVQAAKLAGVAPQKVMADIADSAEETAVFFGGSVDALSKAAIKAAALGTSIKQASEVANNLLDFENSITAELEASAMLGSTINFNKARELAANNDIVGAQQAVLDSLEKSVDLNNINKFQLDSIAKASGMPVAELRKQLNLRQKFGTLDKQQMTAAMNLLNSGKDLANISEADLKKQTEQVKAQQEMQGLIEGVKNRFAAVGAQISMAFAPFAKQILPILDMVVDTVTVLAYPFIQIGKLISFIGEQASKLGGYFSSGTKELSTFGKILKYIAGLGIIAAAYAAFTSIAGFMPIVGPILGAAAAATVIAAGFGVLNSIGDMASPADGRTQVSTKEGGLFELSPNDDIAAGPGILDTIASGGGVLGAAASLFGGRSRGGGMDSSPIVRAIEDLGNDIRNLQVVVNMDGKKVTDGVSKVVSRNQTNSAGVTV